jgi:hypothetical protein
VSIKHFSACGVGLRIVQCIDNEGKSSLNTRGHVNFELPSKNQQKKKLTGHG